MNASLEQVCKHLPYFSFPLLHQLKVRRKKQTIQMWQVLIIREGGSKQGGGTGDRGQGTRLSAVLCMYNVIQFTLHYL